MKRKIIVTLLILGISLIILARAPRPNPIIDFMSKTYSPRQFSDSFISNETIKLILNAGNKAPSATNAQPWHFTVVRNMEIVKEIIPNVVDNNVLIVVSGSEKARFSVEFDTALVTQNMYLAAQALGLGARMYAMPVQNINENMREKLQIPDDFRVIIVLRLGYPDSKIDASTAASPRHDLESKVNYID